MPGVKVQEIDGKWYVVDADGEPVGKGYESRDEAEAALGGMSKRGKGKAFAELRDVEIMRVGVHNGHRIRTRDLDEMVGAFGKVGFQPPLKLDIGGSRPTHGEGGPAYGWVSALRRVGDILVADFRDVVDALIPLIERKQYDTVSAEIYNDYERNGKRFGSVLKAVELLGASIPAVPDLKPVSASLGFSQADESQETFVITFEKERPMPDKPKDADRVKELEEMVKNLELKLADAQEKLAAMGKVVKMDFADSDAYKTMATEIATLKEKDRQGWIGRLVADCSLPAMRRHVAIFADIVSGVPEDKVWTFSDTGADGKPVEKKILAREAVESFVRDVNANAAILFKQGTTAKHDRPQGDEEAKTSTDAGLKLHNFAMDIRANDATGKTSYEDALRKAYQEHPDLYKVYAQG